MNKYRMVIGKTSGLKAIIINTTSEVVTEHGQPERYAELRKKYLLNKKRAERNDAMNSLGLVSYRNQSGTVCWE